MSAIKLSTPSSGSISLSPANTASNLTITVPAVTGTMATVDGSGNMSVTGNLSFNSGYGSSAVAYGCRAWVNFNGTGTVAIRTSGNVSSIGDEAVGSYRINFINAMPDLNYATTGSSWFSGTTASLFAIESPPSSTTSKLVQTQTASASATVDVNHCCVAIFR